MKLTYLKPKSSEEVDALLSMSVKDLINVWNNCNSDSRKFIQERLEKTKNTVTGDTKELVLLWGTSYGGGQIIIQSMLNKTNIQMRALLRFIKTFPTFTK